MAIESEAMLYAPIKDYLEAQGYLVHAEVKACDVVAIKGEDVIVVEMKRQFNLKLIMQAIQRQQVCSSVYIAFPVTKTIANRRRMNEIKALAKRLHLGLILVHDRPSGLAVEVPLLPDFQVFRVNVKAQKAFMKELLSREHSVNTGGITKQRIITAHKERALSIAAFLKVHGPMGIGDIATYLNLTKDVVGVDLRSNLYKWYRRESRGVYAFNDEYDDDFRNFGDLVTFYMDRAQRYSQPPNPLK